MGVALGGGVGSAGHVRSAGVALRTLTARLVEDDSTDGILTTGSPQTAGVNTLT